MHRSTVAPVAGAAVDVDCNSGTVDVHVGSLDSHTITLGISVTNSDDGTRHSEFVRNVIGTSVSGSSFVYADVLVTNDATGSVGKLAVAVTHDNPGTGCHFSGMITPSP